MREAFVVANVEVEAVLLDVGAKEEVDVALLQTKGTWVAPDVAVIMGSSVQIPSTRNGTFLCEYTNDSFESSGCKPLTRSPRYDTPPSLFFTRCKQRPGEAIASDWTRGYAEQRFQ